MQILTYIECVVDHESKTLSESNYICLFIFLLLVSYASFSCIA